MSDPHTLAKVVDQLPGARVLCVGDIMLDRFIVGTVDRISPEAPIPVLKVEEERRMLGGVGNVAHNLATLGARAVLVAVVGEDAAGAEIAAMLGEIAQIEPILLTDSNRPTAVKERYVAKRQQLLRADREATADLDEDRSASLLAAVDRHLPACQAVVLSDYGKGVLTVGVVRAIIERAARAKVPVIVDPNGRDYARYRGATVVSPNRAELSLASGRSCRSSAEIIAAARDVMARCGIDTLLVTRSEDGLSLIGATGSVVHLPAQAREVYDVSGAGDTVVATFAAAVAVRAEAAVAAALGNTAAGVVVQKFGTATVYPEDIIAALHESELRVSEAKVKPLAAALRVIDGWRRQGRRIGFTNGTFDLLHPGHVASIRQARVACDRLVVGLNSDDSVKRYKGPTRPVQNATSRAVVLGAFEQVDLIVIFDDDTPIRLIEAVRPDVLVKGADYRVDQVVGADFVQAYGGKVLLTEFVDGHSTTHTIARLAKQGS